jgi:hypothetical protein
MFLEEGEDMMPSLIDLTEKQRETRKEGFSVMRWSNQPGVYKKIFYLGKQEYVRKVVHGCDWSCIRQTLLKSRENIRVTTR